MPLKIQFLGGSSQSFTCPVWTLKYLRPAAASKAKAMAVPVAHIMAKAGWARVTTFAKYYDKIINRDTDQFQEAVLA